MSSRDPKEIVRTGYDALSQLYRADTDAPPNHMTWTDLLVSLLPPPLNSDPILDVGCGCGVPVAQRLSDAGYKVTGVDISAVQIERAKALVPRGRFIQADITSPELTQQILGSESMHTDSDTANSTQGFAAIIALYVLIHIPVDEQPALIRRMAEWLVEGGLCLMVVGVTPWTGEVGGSDESVKMWWAHAGVDDYRAWVKDAGFDIEKDEYVEDDMGGGGHQLMLLKKRRRQG